MNRGDEGNKNRSANRPNGLMKRTHLSISVPFFLFVDDEPFVAMHFSEPSFEIVQPWFRERLTELGDSRLKCGATSASEDRVGKRQGQVTEVPMKGLPIRVRLQARKLAP
jgi:hypothetical protein